MALRDYQRAGEVAEWKPEEVRSYLLDKGYVFGPGGLATGVDGLVRADIDANVPNATWTADLDAFVPSPDPLRLAREQLIKAARTIKAKAPAARTEIEKTILAIIVALRSDG